MNAKINRGKEWRDLFEQILFSFRLSGNELSEKAGVRQSTISRIIRGETANPYPATIRKVEESLSIKIIEDENQRLRFIKSERGKKIKTVLKESDLFEPKYPVVEVPFLDKKRSNFMEIIHALIGNERQKYQSIVSEMIKDRIAIPHNSGNVVATRITTDKNFPYLINEDIIVLDLMAEINSGDFAAVVLDDHTRLMARVYFETKDQIRITFYNPAFEGMIVSKDRILFMIKVVKVIRENL